jgi:hypothetical protein
MHLWHDYLSEKASQWSYFLNESWGAAAAVFFRWTNFAHFKRWGKSWLQLWLSSSSYLHWLYSSCWILFLKTTIDCQTIISCWLRSGNCNPCQTRWSRIFVMVIIRMTSLLRLFFLEAACRSSCFQRVPYRSASRQRETSIWSSQAT